MVTSMSSNAAQGVDHGDVLRELIRDEQNTGNSPTHPQASGWNPGAGLSNTGGEVSQSPTSDSNYNISPSEQRQLQSHWFGNEQQTTQSENVNTAQSQDSDMEMNPTNTVDPIPPPLTGIEACIDRIMRNPILTRGSGRQLDTFIYIGRLCLNNCDLEDRLQDYFRNNPILVERRKLEALNSPFFNKCLGGMYQTQKWKVLKDKAASHVLPLGIKYIINMTPAIEGIEAVQAIQDQSCPPGVLHWKESQIRWGNHATVVGGLDENDNDISPKAIAMEYSCVRHVKSIERFMTALQGNDPKFDSAPKVYTAVMVSKPWGIQGQHPLTDYVARWLYDHDGNSYFVEAFPEIVLKMADVLKCAPLCQDAFGILVGEAALDSILTHAYPDGQWKTAYLRIRGDIEEDWLSRIQHSRNSFIDRVRNTFDTLAGEDMEWVASMSSVRRLQFKAQYTRNTAQFNTFLHLLKCFIRGAIYKLLCDDYKDQYDWGNSVKIASKSNYGDGLYPRGITDIVWTTLRGPERIFTARFWRAMTNSYLRRDNRSNLTNQNLIGTTFLDCGISSICSEYADGPLMEKITLKSLIEALQSPESTRSSFGYHDRDYTANRNSHGSLSEAHQRIVDNMSRAAKIEQALSSLKQEFAGEGNQSSSQGQNSQGSVLPIRIPFSQSNSSNHDFSRSPQFTCSKAGCMVTLYSLSPLSSCNRCGLHYCEDHTAQNTHHCYALTVAPTFQRQETQPSNLNIERASHEQERQSSVSFNTVPLDRYSSLNRDNEDPSFTIDPSHSIPIQFREKLSVIQDILASAMQDIHRISRQMLSGTAGGNLGTLDGSARITHTLNCLTEDEIKFLPLWAEGLDDGTGGVFGEQIPVANEDDLAYKSNGKRLVTRSESSDYSFVSDTVDSSVNTSTMANDGYRDTLPRGRVVAMDETDSSSEGGWSYIQDSIDDKKGKSRAVNTQNASEVASTLGALEDAIVIDGTNLDGSTLDQEQMEVLSFTSSQMTIRKTGDHDEIISEDMEEDSYNGFDEQGFDDDMMFDDDLKEAGPSKQPLASQKQSAFSAVTTDSFSKSIWNDSRAHISYTYKDEPDYDLMTRD